MGSDQSDHELVDLQCGNRLMASIVIFVDSWTMMLMVTRKTVAWTPFLNLDIHLVFEFLFLSKQALTTAKASVFGSNHLLCYLIGIILSWTSCPYFLSLTD